MEGTYPIIIDGEIVGKLVVSVRGAQTVFDAVCRMLPGIVRLSVYGGGREGCLGVLTPAGDGLSLHKALSRAALRDFPASIDSVEPAGLHREPAPAEENIPMEEVPARVETPMAPAPEPERYWYASTDGALLCFDGARSLVAFPTDDPRIPAEAAGERCTVEGRDYRVFPTENGRVVW